jgi:hypothetical protein
MSYIASISYGKDSLKMLDVIKIRGLPLDRIITFDVWATDTIPAEFPEITEFKKKIDFYIKGKYGIEVEHLCARSKDGTKITYEKEFYKTRQNGKFVGTINGFPMTLCAWCNSRLKIAAKRGSVKPGDVQYIGIAFDEKKRHKILSNTIVSPLVDFQIDEDLCGLHCKLEGILAPSYAVSHRDGCWFCHNQGVNQLRNLRKKYPEYWNMLLQWQKDSPFPFKADGRTVQDYEQRFRLEDEGIIAPEETFHWSMLNSPVQLRLNF